MGNFVKILILDSKVDELKKDGRISGKWLVVSS